MCKKSKKYVKSVKNVTSESESESVVTLPELSSLKKSVQAQVDAR